MTCKEKAEVVFREELNRMKDQGLVDDILTIFEEQVPAYFFTAPAAKSGKYHPAVSNGRYGLIRHTLLVCNVAREFMQAFDVHDQTMKDNIIAACILHDCVKYGKFADENGKSNENTTRTHGYEAMHILIQYDFPYEVCRAVGGHMGVWSCEGAKPYLFTEKPNVVTEIVMLADYMASRKFDDKYAKLASVNYELLLED